MVSVCEWLLLVFIAYYFMVFINITTLITNQRATHTTLGRCIAIHTVAAIKNIAQRTPTTCAWSKLFNAMDVAFATWASGYQFV